MAYEDGAELVTISELADALSGVAEAIEVSDPMTYVSSRDLGELENFERT